MGNINFEGAEITVYYNDNEVTIPLSSTQFAACAKLLGLQLSANDNVSCFSDATIQQFMTLSSNPLKLQMK